MSEQKMREALEKIADWASHDLELAVNLGSNGVRDFYRAIAREALAAPAGEQVGLTKREIDGLLKECIDVLHCHQRNMQKDLLTRLRAARRVIATKRGGAA